MKALGAAIAASVILLAGSVAIPEASAQDIRIGPGVIRIGIVTAGTGDVTDGMIGGTGETVAAQSSSASAGMAE